MEKYYTVQEARDILKVADATVRKYLMDGSLKGKKIGRRWRIPEGAIKAFLDTNGGQPDAGEAKDENRRGKNDSGAD